MHLNPYGELLYGALGRAGIELVTDAPLEASWLWRRRRDITFLHFHWDGGHYESTSTTWTTLRSWLGVARQSALLLLARGLGYRIVWTVHEVLPHETRSVARDWVAAKVLAHVSHQIMALDRATAVLVARTLLLGQRQVTVVPHGSYAGIYPRGRSREEVRRAWDLPEEAFVFLAFGSLRAYKRIDLLLDAFAQVPDPDAALVISGQFIWRSRQPEFERHTLAQLEAAAAADHRIRVRIGRVPDEEVVELHEASDACVLARGDGWTSGSLFLALTSGLPVVAARRPAYAEALANGAAGWFFEPDDARSLGSTLSRVAREPAVAATKAVAARRVAAGLDWDDAAATTLDVLRSTLP